MLNKIQKKSHIRSLTSHKPLQAKPAGQAIRKDEATTHDRLTNSVVNGSPVTNVTNKHNFNTLD